MKTKPNKTPKQIDKKGTVFLMRQAESPGMLHPLFNYPVHLVSHDPGLWEVTCSGRGRHGGY